METSTSTRVTKIKEYLLQQLCLLQKESEEKGKREFSIETGGDAIDRATQESLIVQKIRDFERRQDKINAINLALHKIADGWEVTCSSCEKDISLRRIETCPGTDLCVPCKEIAEDLEKKFRR